MSTLLTMYAAQANSPFTTTLGEISASATSVTVDDASVLPSSIPFLLTLGYDKTISETVQVTAVNGNTLTIVRGLDGPALMWVAGTKCARVLTAKDLNDIQANIRLLNDEKAEPGDIPSPSSVNPTMDGTAAAGTSNDYARADHIHPSDTGKQNAIGANGILKSDGQGNVIAAQAGTDYQAPLEAGTDYQTPLVPEKLAYYGVCSTAAATQAKVVSIAGITALVSGLSIKVKFTNAQTYNGTPTLNLNSLGAKSIMRNGTTGAACYQWQAGEVLDLVYDGTNWIISEAAHATTTYYGLVKLSSAFNSESETEAATPKAVKLAYDGAEAAWNLANAAIPGNQKGAADGVATLDAYGKITPAQATARMVTITSNTTLSAAHNGCRILAVGTVTVTIPSTLAAGMEVEVYNYGTGVVTIAAASGVSLNGTAADSRTLDNKYDVASLAALTATDWSIHKGDAA